MEKINHFKIKKSMNREGDLLPQELIKFRKIEQVFRESCDQFGYKEIKTSTIEPFFLFTATHVLTPELLERSYSFIDWESSKGERVSLRPDCTVSVCRYYLDYQENFPKKSKNEKFYYIETVYRLDQNESRTLQETWHFGIENIGGKSPLSDVETIFIATEVLKKLDIPNYHLVLSYPKIIIECIKLVFGEGQKKEVLDIINRKKTTNIRTIISQLNKIKQHNQFFEIFTKLISYKGANASYVKNLLSEFKLPESNLGLREYINSIQEYLQKFIDISTLLDKLNTSYEIDFALSQEFEYYTGIHFHFLSDNGNILCSGGRYDSLLRNIGENLQEDIPAVGMAFSAKEMFEIISSEKPFPQLQNIGVVVQNLTLDNVQVGQKLCSKFNSLGFHTTILLTVPSRESMQNYGMVLEVDKELFEEGYNILFTQQIEKPFVQNLFGNNHINE
ncbi:MAG: ATP phosphoribosyltransferase regulatory subunit [Leptospiraceae bacterium]|nr:ATP phosphoribosyltransferase regulatory subunit [Leptospiraceae bacterium]MCP5493028.1 ATP phosphoribosyltransferase regulatory subunit [Leptospiraceae bacterium]